MGHVRISTVVRGLAVLAVAGALPAVPVAGNAQETAASSPAAAARIGGQAPPGEVVTLPTGERVVLASGAGGRAVRSVQRAAGTALGPASEPARVSTMAVGDHFYVVPDEAMPYVGRQLDLAMFDVAAPVAELHVQWAPGARAHAVPGLDLQPAGAGRSTARIADPAAFGAALAEATRDARAAAVRPGAAPGAQAAALADGGPLAGIQAVHPGIQAVHAGAPAADPAPTASPQFPLATLTVRGLDTLGAPAFSGTVTVTNAEDVQRFSSLQAFADGQVSFSVPLGHYSIGVAITTYDAGHEYLGDALLFFPQIDVTENGTVVTAEAGAARTVVPVPATPDPSKLEQLQATYSRVSAAGYDSTTAYMMFGGSPELSVTPTAPVSIGEVHWYTYFRLNSPSTAATPYLYDLVFPSDTGVPAQFPTAVPARELARVDATYAAEAGPATINTSRASFQYWEKFPIRFASTAVAPLRRTEYVSALPDVSWIGTALARPEEGNGLAQTPLTAYAAGEHAADNYLRAPAVPGVDRGTVRAEPCAICRQGDRLLLNLRPWTDAGGHAVQMAATDTTTATVGSRLYADGTLVADGTSPTGEVTVPAGAERLKLELDTNVSAPWTTTASRVTTAWTWNTAAPTGSPPEGRTCSRPDQPCAFQPLLFAEYAAGADTTNAVPAGIATPLTVVVRHQAYDEAPAADHLTLEVSGDDGATWAPVTAAAAGGGRFTATVTPAAGTGFLSLRINATDPLGGTLDQTVVRALRVAG
jgi:hypothetical protein